MTKVGRPEGVYKHISSLTGKPIPAQAWLKEQRKIKVLQNQELESKKFTKSGNLRLDYLLNLREKLEEMRKVIEKLTLFEFGVQDIA